MALAVDWNRRGRLVQGGDVHGGHGCLISWSINIRLLNLASPSDESMVPGRIGRCQVRKGVEQSRSTTTRCQFLLFPYISKSVTEASNSSNTHPFTTGGMRNVIWNTESSADHVPAEIETGMSDSGINFGLVRLLRTLTSRTQSTKEFLSTLSSGSHIRRRGWSTGLCCVRVPVRTRT